MAEVAPTDSLRARVLAATATRPALTRRQGRRAGGVLVAASIALAVTVFARTGAVAHSGGGTLGLTIALATGWALVSAVLTWIVVGRSGSTMARSPVVLTAAVLVTPVLLFAWTHLFSGAYVEPFQRVGYRCLGYTLAISALPLASFLALKRAVEPRHPAALGAGAGAACAAWAGALIDLWCPLTNTLHVLVGHVAPLVVATAIGAFFGRFTLGARRR